MHKKIEKQESVGVSTDKSSSYNRGRGSKSLGRKDDNDGNMNDEWIPNPSFPMALSLFRANVISLCLRSGIEGSSLWPHEAILLNLDLLHSKCLGEGNKMVLNSMKYQTNFKSSGSNPFPVVSHDINCNMGLEYERQEDGNKAVHGNGNGNGSLVINREKERVKEENTLLPGLTRRYISKRIIKPDNVGPILISKNITEIMNYFE